MYLPLLEVDLSSGVVSPLRLPAGVREEWVGGTGLGLWLLSRELRRGLRASDPECPVFVLTGPLTGTQVPQSSDWVIVTVNADLPTHLCVSHAHGYFGARLRQADGMGLCCEDVPSRRCISGSTTGTPSCALRTGCGG